MRVQSISSFYNAASRVNGLDRVARMEQVKAAQAQTSSEDSSKETVEEAVANGVKQTLVSSENSYQKQMLDDPEFAMNRMASRLMDKLPQILEDMNKVSEADLTETTEKTPTKIVINENSNVNYENNINRQLQDIAL